MSEKTANWAKHNRRRDLPKEDTLPPDEERALKTMQREAKENGATLATGGKGGLPPSAVLGRMRKAGWKCMRCGTKKMLSMHHQGGIVSSPKLSKMGHRMIPQNLMVICEKCHDMMHQQARKEGIDSSQITPEGDK